MTRREIVYSILDQIKSTNTDSYIVEEHVLFLMNIYRSFLIEQKKKQDKLEDLSDSYQQEICLDLELVDSIPGVPCAGQYLKSVQEIPTLLKQDDTKVYPYDYFSDNITLVSKERFGFVGYNSYMSNIIYAAIDSNKHLYLKSNNPQFKYLDKVRFSGIFEDADKAAEMSCDNKGGDGSTECTDILDKEFPMAPELVPQMIQFIVKDLYQALARPADRDNNDADDIASMLNYIARNMKNNYQKQLEV